LPTVERDTPGKQISNSLVLHALQPTYDQQPQIELVDEKGFDDIPWKSDTLKLLITMMGELSAMSKSSWPVVVARSLQSETLTVLPLQLSKG
jgi:hypothetical protein